MQVLKTEVRSKILQEAEQVFYDKGYANASMREIATRAGVTVGNIYRYYKNKDALFSAIVDDTYMKLMDIVDMEILDHYGFSEEGYGVLKQTIITKVMEILQKNRLVTMILLEGSNGTRYENFKEAYIDLIEKQYMPPVLNKVMEKGIDIDTALFSKIIARGCFEAMVEVTRTFSTPSDLEKHLNWAMDFYLYSIIDRFKQADKQADNQKEAR